MTEPLLSDTCPRCNAQIPASQPSVCPSCQYPLLPEETDDNVDDPASEQLRRPTRESNPAQTMTNTRVLVGSVPVVRPARRTPLGWILVPVAIVLATLAGAGTYVGMRHLARQDTGGGATPSPSAGVSVSASAAARLTRIDSAVVEAEASSTLPADDLDSYGVSKTLDGKTSTAWNSHGEKVGADAEVALTYTFPEPMRIGRIEFYNGSQKSDGMFERNGRVKSLTVEAGGVERLFKVKDAQGKQTFAFAFPESDTVTLTVQDVYRGSRYSDLGVSEVIFYTRG